MLRWVRVSLGQPQRTGGPALQAIGAACVLLGLVLAPLATTVRAEGAHQGDDSFGASPTLPLFVAFTTEGRQTTLRISMRNTGKAAWEPGQGIKLSRVEGDEATAAGASYPLEGTVRPGQSATWQVVVTPVSAGARSLRYTMVHQAQPFGSQARAMVIVLPRLSNLEHALGGVGMESAVQTLADWMDRAFGDVLRKFAASVHGAFDSFINGPAFGGLSR